MTELICAIRSTYLIFLFGRCLSHHVPYTYRIIVEVYTCCIETHNGVVANNMLSLC